MATDINTILWAIVAIMAILTVIFYKDKKDTAILAGIVALVLAGLLMFTTGGIDLGNETYTYTVAPETSVGDIVPGCQIKPYTTLKVDTQIAGSNSYITAAGTVSFYEAGVNPSDANANALDTATIASGVGNTTSAKLKSCVLYSVVFSGAGTYYDMWWNGGADSALPYVDTDESAISTSSISFRGIKTVATIDDPIEENSVTGSVNGQTSNFSLTLDTAEIMGAAGAAADGDTLVYDISNGDGLFYLDLALGAGSSGYTYLEEPVLCFVRDLTSRPNGDEFSSVTVDPRTGTDFGIPSDITNYVNTETCVSLGNEITGGQSGTYRLSFTVDEDEFDSTDKFYIYMDDLGSFNGHDILLSNTGATASAVVTLTAQA